MSVFICAGCNCSPTRGPYSHSIMIFLPVKYPSNGLKLCDVGNTHISFIVEEDLSAGPHPVSFD